MWRVHGLREQATAASINFTQGVKFFTRYAVGQGARFGVGHGAMFFFCKARGKDFLLVTGRCLLSLKVIVGVQLYVL